ncbi:hypothetical protein EON80_23220, partial [bacterium]
MVTLPEDENAVSESSDLNSSPTFESSSELAFPADENSELPSFIVKEAAAHSTSTTNVTKVIKVVTTETVTTEKVSVVTEIIQPFPSFDKRFRGLLAEKRDSDDEKTVKIKTTITA